MRKINIKATLIFTTFWLIVGAVYVFDNNEPQFQDKPAELADLTFLVTKSDLIAIAFLSGGLDKGKNLSFFKNPPKRVEGRIEQIIFGDQNIESVTISSKPKYLSENVIDMITFLRNGRHLVFLSKSGDLYQPTAQGSLLDFFNNNVYPTWRTDHYTRIDTDGTPLSQGVPIEQVIKEIKDKI
ncbi:hypothetical protein [Desulfosediminicola flagellatus]|uniref:hypothetical protein n=1 Tax=Desulfosediminicola flagellatus TaxID=2569541 RepID=UPI0010AB82AE|nr:hypothetical protein [Desulfosediminicola flagellatus]